MLDKRASDINLNGSAIIDWFRHMTLNNATFVGQTFLRAYWYDGAFDPSHEMYTNQRRVHNAIARTPSVQLRLGHITEYQSRLENPIKSALQRTAANLNINPEKLLEEFDRQWTFQSERHQKGVDTLIAMDMVRLASRSVCSTAILIAGDLDLAEIVRTVQDFGVRVIIATPNHQSVARELLQLADDVIDITAGDFRSMLWSI